MSRLSCILLLLGVVACGEQPDVQISDHREDTRYVDANPDSPLDADGKAQLSAALDRLEAMTEAGEMELTQDLASFTLDRLADGDVLIGSVAGARGIDRWHMCKDYELPACAGTWPDDPEWMGDESVSELLTDELDGYQWGNRLYFSFRDDTNAETVAATIVHEVNHVLNRSECSYYEDIDTHRLDHTLAYVEEYRAFFTECLYSEDANAELDVCNDHAVDHLIGYELTPDLSSILPDDSEDPRLLGEMLLEASPEDGYGSVVPTEDVWPESFGPCSCIGTSRDDSGYCRQANGRFAVDTCCE